MRGKIDACYIIVRLSQLPALHNHFSTNLSGPPACKAPLPEPPLSQSVSSTSKHAPPSERLTCTYTSSSMAGCSVDPSTLRLPQPTTIRLSTNETEQPALQGVSASTLTTVHAGSSTLTLTRIRCRQVHGTCHWYRQVCKRCQDAAPTAHTPVEAPCTTVRMNGWEPYSVTLSIVHSAGHRKTCRSPFHTVCRCASRSTSATKYHMCMGLNAVGSLICTSVQYTAVQNHLGLLSNQWYDHAQ